MFRQTGLAPHDVQAMFNASPNAYVVLDRTLRITGADRAYLTVTGRTAEDIAGRSMFEAFPSEPESEHGQRPRQSLARVLSPGMVIAVASGRGGRAAAAQVRDAVPLDKPFGIDALEALLARLPRA